MSRVRSRHTGPELRVRKVLHAAGLRYRLHRRDLPGSPDIVFGRCRLAVFVHGCFWHQHPGCKKATIPATNSDWWQEKLERNQARDARVNDALLDAGWTSIVIWECTIADPLLVDRIAAVVRRLNS